MSADAAEFSRPVSLARLGPTPFRQEIEATAEERGQLAQRFGLIALERLTAVVELVRQGRDLVVLRAGFAAAFVQGCVVTLEPVAGTICERFSLRYGPPDAETGDGLLDDVDGEAFEPLSGDAIDIGEAVAQEFSLALPPFPRHPDAPMAAETTDSTACPTTGNLS